MTEAAALGGVPAEPTDRRDPGVGVDGAGSRLVEALSELGWLPPVEWCDDVDADRLEQVGEIVRQSLAEDLAIARMRSRTARETAAATLGQAAAARRRATAALDRSTRLAAAYRALIASETTARPGPIAPGPIAEAPIAEGPITEGTGASSAVGVDLARRALEAKLADLRLEVAQLHRALATRTIVGQATGVVMQSLGCSPDMAWEALRALSQDSNTPVRELAASIVDQVGSGRIREIDALRRRSTASAAAQLDQQGAIPPRRSASDRSLRSPVSVWAARPQGK